MHVESHQSIEELEAAAREEHNGRVRDRIRGVIMAKRGKTAKEIGECFGVSARAVQGWVRKFNNKGLKGLPDAPRSGQPRKCSQDKFDAIRKRVLDGPRDGDGVCTLRGRDVQRILQDEFGVVQTLSATYELLHTLGLEPLRPRPRHRKNDPEAMKAWEEAAPLFSSVSATSTPISKSRSGTRTRRASASRVR